MIERADSIVVPWISGGHLIGDSEMLRNEGQSISPRLLYNFYQGFVLCVENTILFFWAQLQKPGNKSEFDLKKVGAPNSESLIFRNKPLLRIVRLVGIY